MEYRINHQLFEVIGGSRHPERDYRIVLDLQVGQYFQKENLSELWAMLVRTKTQLALVRSR